MDLLVRWNKMTTKKFQNKKTIYKKSHLKSGFKTSINWG